MSKKPIFTATHPRAISSAFERVYHSSNNPLLHPRLIIEQVFLTRRDMTCFHEPFGDVYYYSAERLGERYEDDEKARLASGFSNYTYKSVFDEIEKGGSEVGTFPSSSSAYPYPRMYSSLLSSLHLLVLHRVAPFFQSNAFSSISN